MSKIKIDISNMDADERAEMVLLKALESAENALGEALIAIDATPARSSSRLSQKALKARHKIQILKAQVHDVRENSLEFRQAIRRVLDREFAKQLRKNERLAA